MGCLTIASGFLFSGRDTAGIAHFAVALYAFVDATLHFMPDDRPREKVALRVGGLSFLLVVALPLVIVDLCASASGLWSAAILLTIFAPVLVLLLCLEYAYRRQRSRRF